MTKLFMFEKPLGMRDTLPLLYGARNKVRNKMLQEINSWGYQMLETPALEYYETVGAASAILDQQLFKLLDQQGHTLVLRPDMTSPIARVAASKLLQSRIPLRLSYSANVYRAQQREGGRPAEFEQIGVECIGNSTVSGDAESIALLISTLQAAGLTDFKVSIGHIGFVQQLFLHILGNEERAEQCRKYLFEKNYVGYREHVKSLPLSSIDKQRLLGLLSLRGTDEIFQPGKDILEDEKSIHAIEQLEVLWKQLQEFNVHSYVSFDLTAVSHMNYYTGILFEVYANHVGLPIGNGGRYDNLLDKFGYHAPATGFAIIMDRLLEALGDIEEDHDMTCVLYSNERRMEAINLAKELRANGEAVVLQEVTGVTDLDAFTKNFQSVQYMIGSRKEEL
ncbi:ATP phosphoribosyltransferase regulatory subunit [Bacillus massiliigorillae]|uniref:ATP phosphoribosyltransferase regulatory subunit n=1 Tax=Bacillus massiliigorillae TaxID=1243664 RepID=UPI0003A4A619|nr:ATP phosphoribosyltransferase regulatory subunit [Bacillus massiliigorillae]